jgi:hypothetical protein
MRRCNLTSDKCGYITSKSDHVTYRKIFVTYPEFHVTDTEQDETAVWVRFCKTFVCLHVEKNGSV